MANWDALFDGAMLGGLMGMGIALYWYKRAIDALTSAQQTNDQRITVQRERVDEIREYVGMPVAPPLPGTPTPRLVPEMNGPMDPAYPCRLFHTRHCPVSYGDVCGPRPCARFESHDRDPWAPELRPAEARRDDQ